MMNPVEFKGVKYRSINAMLRAIGISKATYCKRKKQGVPLDAPKHHGPRRKITVDGVIYSSIKEYCLSAGITRSGYQYRVKKAFKVSRYRRPVEYNGVKYPSINAMLRAIGISKATYCKRKKQGVPLDAPKHHGPRRKITVDGVIYSSIKEYCLSAGITRSGYQYRVKKAFKVSRYRRPVEYNGVKYPSINALARALGLTRAKARDLLGL